MGIGLKFELSRHGFYPAGGGSVTATIQPLVTPVPLVLLERGELRGRVAVAMAGGMPQDVARRQVEILRKGLQWKRGAASAASDEYRHERITDLAGSGNFVYAALLYDSVTAVFSSVGDRGKSANTVAQEVVDEVDTYCHALHSAPVDEYLSDQLLLPMALGVGGSFRTVTASLHMTTNAALIDVFLGPRTVAWTALPTGDVLVEVTGRFALVSGSTTAKSAAAESSVGGAASSEPLGVAAQSVAAEATTETRSTADGSAVVPSSLGGP